MASRGFDGAFLAGGLRFLRLFGVGGATSAPGSHLPRLVATDTRCGRFHITSRLVGSVAGCYRLGGYVNAADVVT